MAAPTVEVEGGKQLRKTLKGVEDGLKDLTALHASIAGMVVDRARETAPVRTGALVQSVRGSGTARASIVRAGGAKVPYAGPIHWGWPRHNIIGQPFLTSAASDTESQWIVKYEETVNGLLDKVHGA